MKKVTLSIVCALTLLACERQGEGPAPEPASGSSEGAPSEVSVGPPARDWKTPPPRADEELDRALATFAAACPRATECDGDVRRELFDAARLALGRKPVAALAALAAAASRGGPDAMAAAALTELLRSGDVLGELDAEVLESTSKRLIEVWRAVSSSTAVEEAIALAELTARVALAAGQAEALLEVAAASPSDEARAALYRWMLTTRDEQVFEALVQLWDARKEPEAVRAGAARAALEVEEWPASWKERLCDQSRNQLEGGDPKLARWWTATSWRCGGEYRVAALDEANRRLELHTYDATFAPAFAQGPCAAKAGAGNQEERKQACEAPRALLERVLEDAKVSSEVKGEAALALARGWPDAGTLATLERVVKSSDPVVAAAAKKALESTSR